ncbi:MAG: glycosyltransferase family 2 protein [Burkholderiaceae bacterium]|nr:glycosyltransferase family 2 protein [Burkholderiaceae bacterium]
MSMHLGADVGSSDMVPDAESAPAHWVVLMTCFNRRDKTLACLHSLSPNRAALADEGVQLSVVLIDDGSQDGTAQAVREAFPWVQVVSGDGQLYWTRGMHEAWTLALTRQPSHVVWLNDDTLLLPDALVRLRACAVALQARGEPPSVVVGSTFDSATLKRSYGGEMQRRGWRKSRFDPVEPDPDMPLRCDSMTGNLVLVPHAVWARVGMLDPCFEHAMGDTDYALRCRVLGVPVWLAPGFHGSCSDNDVGGGYRDARLPKLRRWRLMLDRKGLPWRSWLRLTRRHMGWNWPLYFLWPYLALWLGRSS